MQQESFKHTKRKQNGKRFSKFKIKKKKKKVKKDYH